MVNTGGGDAASCLEGSGGAVEGGIRIVHREERLKPGAARNLGIAASRADRIAFLAEDCRAEPGWLAARLARHRAGHAAVASALTTSHPRNVFAWASHLSLFVRRLPSAPPEHVLAYGVSYERGLFERYGLFREDLRTGEDTEFHLRLPAAGKPVRAPEIRTVHASPMTPWRMLSDQFARGRRTALAWRAINAMTPRSVARAAIFRTRDSMRLAARAMQGRERLFLYGALPCIPLCSLAYALGAMQALQSGRFARMRWGFR